MYGFYILYKLIMNQLHKYVRSFFLAFVTYTAYIWNTQAIFWTNNSGIRYCQGNDCWLDRGVTQVRQWISDIETDRTLSEYIQAVVWYALTFLSIVAVIYIIYAWFRILIWNWDEEALKKSKTTIIYVLIWLTLMWLAWSITIFILDLFRA